MRLDFLVPIFGILLLMIPVLGLTTIATLRWGLMPFMERLARELEGSGFVASKVVEDRVAALTRELERVTGEVERLREVQEFDRRLLESGTGDAPPPDDAAGGDTSGPPAGAQGDRGPEPSRR